MNSKSTNFNANNPPRPNELETWLSDACHPPKTPTKRQPSQHQPSIFARLSPLPFPPKLDPRTGEISFSSHHEMLIVQTPMPKENSKFMVDEENEGLNYAIENRIIFESSSQSELNNSSEQASSSQQDEEREDEQKEEDPQVASEQDSEGYEPYQQGNPQIHDKQSKISRNIKKQPSSQSNKDNSSKRVVCNCKKTKCLKLYCDCFRLNQTCDGCNCVGCHNLDIYYEERNNAIMALMDRNPDPFGQKIQADKHLKGCNCKKSNCLKKYCECYQAGLRCGENCKCEECKNVPSKPDGPEEGRGASRNTAKKERIMVEM